MEANTKGMVLTCTHAGCHCRVVIQQECHCPGVGEARRTGAPAALSLCLSATAETCRLSGPPA